MKRGAAGLAKSVMGTASSWEAERRREICRECPSRKGAICAECGCLLFAKSRVASESCPLRKW